MQIFIKHLEIFTKLMYNGNIEYFCLTKGDITYMNKFVFSDFICPICKFPLNFDSENEHAQMMCPNCSNKVEPINAALAQRRDNASFPDIRNAPALFAFVDTYFESSIGDDFFTSFDSFTVKKYAYGLGVRCSIDGKDGITDFGWGGAAGAGLWVDQKNGLTVFYAQHVLNSPVIKSRNELIFLIKECLGIIPSAEISDTEDSSRDSFASKYGN